MTPKQQKFHKSLVQAIHLSRRYKEYYSDNKDEYKELLQESFGVQSSKELKINQLILFVDYMNFKNVILPQIPSQAENDKKSDGLCSEAQLKMMRGLWTSFARIPTDEALLEFANKRTKKTYLYVHMISKIEAQKIIPVLKRMQKDT